LRRTKTIENVNVSKKQKPVVDPSHEKRAPELQPWSSQLRS